MAMTLRLSDSELDALRDRASRAGVSMQDAARQAIREYIIRSEHRERVSEATDLILSVHADAIDRLGQ
jgi:hypothetical protein